MEEERLISPELENAGEEKLENSLRPKTLEEYIGQDKVKENMKIYITIWTARIRQNNSIKYYIKWNERKY